MRRARAMTAPGRVVAASTGLAALLAVAYLVLPALGSDLSAQVARAGFFDRHGATPVDLRWYGGVHQFGYSLVSQPVMATIGVRPAGALALIASAAAFAALLVRAGVPRPLLGGLVGAVCIAGNLVSGRVTYALGVAAGLAALLALTVRPHGRPATVLRGAAAAAGALLAAATSPVAGLFVGLAGVALMIDRRYLDGMLLAVPAAVPLAVTALLFADGGWMNISRTDTLRAVLTGVVVAIAVPLRAVRAGALLSSAGVLAAALVHTPVGLNATRLAAMFALPVLAACAGLPGRARTAAVDAPRAPDRNATRPPDHNAVGPPARTGPPGRLGGRRWALVALLVAVTPWQPPVVVDDIRDAGNPTADPGYFAPLRAELAARRLTGRVAVPSTRDYWEAAHLGELPLARGWLRQADIARNPLFFTTLPQAAGTGVPLTADTYRRWLADNAVQYVAVPDADLSWVGRAEAQLVTGGLPYLDLVWSAPHWRLYAVAEPVPLVAAPATLVAQDGAGLTFDVPPAPDAPTAPATPAAGDSPAAAATPAAGDVPAAGTARTVGEVAVRVRYSRWLTATGGAAVVADGDWVRVRVPRPGQYTLTS